MGTLASQAEIGVCEGPGVLPPEKFREYLGLYAKACKLVGRKMVRNAVHNAFLNTLTMRTAFPSKWP